ncbi:MAG: hypothetical protein AAFY66_10830 [Pseudomonadota bacterium]
MKSSMIRRTPSVAAMVLAALLAACGATEDTIPPTLPPFAALIDADGDGEVSAAEWEAYGDSVFARLDTDGSGVIDTVEMDAGFAAFDLDGDGVLRAEEVDASVLDANGDGRITSAEWLGVRAVSALDEDATATLSRDELRRRRTANFNSLDQDRNGRASSIELAASPLGFTLLRF